MDFSELNYPPVKIVERDGKTFVIVDVTNLDGINIQTKVQDKVNNWTFS